MALFQDLNRDILLADADGKKMKALVIFTEAIKYVKVRLCDIHIPSDKITIVSVCMLCGYKIYKQLKFTPSVLAHS